MNTFILAGGKNTRFENEEKALVAIDKKSSIELIIEQLKSLNISIHIIANNSVYKKFDLPVIKDIKKDIGPIGGILTALNESNSDWNIILAADMPFFHIKLITYLVQFKTGFQAVIPSDENGIQPLAALYHKSCLPVINKEINENNYSLHQLIKKLKCNLIPIDQSLSFYSRNLFFNMNSKADLLKVKQFNANTHN